MSEPIRQRVAFEPGNPEKAFYGAPFLPIWGAGQIDSLDQILGAASTGVSSVHGERYDPGSFRRTVHRLVEGKARGIGDVEQVLATYLPSSTILVEECLRSLKTWPVQSLPGTGSNALEIGGQYLALAGSVSVFQLMEGWHAIANEPVPQRLSEDERWEISLSRISAQTNGKELADQLGLLREEASEEGTGAETAINVDSLECVAHFFSTLRLGNLPTLSLTPRRTIYARWRREGRGVASFEFCSGNSVNYVVLPELEANHQRRCHYGTAGVADIRPLIGAFRIGDLVGYDR